VESMYVRKTESLPPDSPTRTLSPFSNKENFFENVIANSRGSSGNDSKKKISDVSIVLPFTFLIQVPGGVE
jgi:hypothetical protein